MHNAYLLKNERSLNLNETPSFTLPPADDPKQPPFQPFLSFCFFPATAMALISLRGTLEQPTFHEGCEWCFVSRHFVLPCNFSAPIPVKERWSNTPSTGDVDGALPLCFLPMFQGIIPLIWGLVLKLFQNFESTLQPLAPVTAIHSRFGGSHLNTSLLLYLCFPPIEDNYMFSPYQGLDLFE